MTKMVEDRKTNLPPQLREICQVHDRLSLGFIEQKSFGLAEQEYRKALSVVIENQGETVRYHKGSLYHQIGYCLFLQENNNDARTYFLYAFIEDCITLTDFPELPAFKNLHGVYQISYQDLRALFEKVRRDYNELIPLTPEVERAMSFIAKKNILLLYQQIQKDEKHYTRMLWGIEVAQVGYMHMRELTENVRAFLATIKR